MRFTVWFAVSVCGCAGVNAKPSSGTGGAGGAFHPSADAAVGTGGGARDAAPPSMDAPMPITDFPPDPVIAPGAPSNAPTLFTTTAPRTTGAPCILSPEPKTLMPRNWLRPRFEYTPAADENLFEITLTVPAFAHRLVIYTATGGSEFVIQAWLMHAAAALPRFRLLRKT